MTSTAMNATGLEYNSGREILTISEYGRHVQKLITHAKTIEDKEERQEFVEKIIDLMHQMNPQNKNVLEYRLRLWRHMFRIANYEIDVEGPEGVSSTKPVEEKVDVHLAYPQSEFRYRHYGNTIQLMVKKAIEMEDEEMKDAYTQVIAAYMKLAYRTWNKEHYVNDEIIKQDLVNISRGKLRLEDDFNIGNLTPMVRKSHHSKGRSNNKGRGKNNNRNNHRRKRK